jgi:RHS repeat-associated protein
MWSWYSDPFGTDLPNENPAAGGTFKYNLRFPGQLYDSHAGLNQNYFRDYDPAIGRYVESDPIGFDGGINTYAYVGSNPLAKSDLTGLAPGPQHLPSDKCAREIANATMAKAKKEGWARLDKRLHCVASCEIMRKCGQMYAFAAGWIRELNQLILQGDLFDKARRDDSTKDREANKRGLECAVKDNCLTWCSQEY